MNPNLRRVASQRALFWLLCCLVIPGCKSDGGDEPQRQQTGQQETASRRAPEPQAAVCDDICFTMAPSAGRHPRLVISSVRYGESDEVTLENLSGAAIPLDGYLFCAGTRCQPFPAGQTLRNGGELVVRLAGAGMGTGEQAQGSVILSGEGMALGPAGEVSVFASAETSAEQVRAFVRWGGPPEGDSHQSQAHAAELWYQGAFVPVCEGYNGFFATGDVSMPRGYRSQADDCF